ncbi:MAG: hypothetical protein Q7K40_03975 [bacterium]|nr:hypothetical protein [bacterium]
MSAKSVCDAIGKTHEFMLALKKAGFDDGLFQQTINSRGNKLAKAMYSAVTGGAQVDDRFELINTFSIVVPKNYDHATQLSSFNKKYRKEFYYYNEAITDKNYANATTKLEPGRSLKVKVFQIKKTVTSEDCLEYLRSQKAIFVGAQGASLAYEQGKGELPIGRWTASFDEKNALWADGGHGVPRLDRDSGGGFEFYLGSFVDGWGDGRCLLCFCDESSDA